MVSAVPLAMPSSEVSYPGASTNSAFVAMEPYVLNIQGTQTTIQLWGAPRKYDLSGYAPFVNPTTGKPDPNTMQAWDPNLGASVQLGAGNITNSGIVGRIDKRTVNNTPVTMIRYNKGDGVTIGKCRSAFNGWAVPPRTHTRWELEVAFGNADGVNDWTLTPTDASPVLFWQMHSDNQNNPPLSAVVDTDSKDPTKLMINFMQRVSTTPVAYPQSIGTIRGISRNTMVSIVIDAFLDERLTSDGGKGLLQIYFNNTLVIEKAGPNLAEGTHPHWWATAMYLFKEASPYAYTRASFWKTSRMLVFPVNATSTPPIPELSAPTNLRLVSVSDKQAQIQWDYAGSGQSGFYLHRKTGSSGSYSQIASTTSLSYNDSSVAASTQYCYVVRAYNSSSTSANSNELCLNTSAPPVSTSLPDVVVTSLKYSNGIFTSVVKNQGTAATPSGVIIGVAYAVNGNYVTWGSAVGPLAAGASVTIGSNGGAYNIPNGTYTIKAFVDDRNRFLESNKNNNQLSQNITVSNLPDVVVTSVNYSNGIFTCVVKNQGAVATPSGVVIGVAYSVDGINRTWGSVSGPLAPGASVTIGTKGGSYAIPKGTHTIKAFVDDVNRFAETNESNNQLSRAITVP